MTVRESSAKRPTEGIQVMLRRFSTCRSSAARWPSYPRRPRTGSATGRGRCRRRCRSCGGCC